jgi:hypothetical protein
MGSADSAVDFPLLHVREMMQSTQRRDAMPPCSFSKQEEGNGPHPKTGPILFLSPKQHSPSSAPAASPSSFAAAAAAAAAAFCAWSWCSHQSQLGFIKKHSGIRFFYN